MSSVEGWIRCETCDEYANGEKAFKDHWNAKHMAPVIAKHLDEGKPGLQYLLAMGGLEEVAKVGDYGSKKYGDRWNYRKGMPWMRLCGSCTRHLWRFIHGEDIDTESGLYHIAHFVFDGLMLLEYVENGIGTDDRPKGNSDNEK